MRLLSFFIAAVLPLVMNAQWNTSSLVNNAVCNFTSNQMSVAAATDGAGGAIFAWMDTRNGSQDIYTQRIDASGNLQWATNGVPVCTAAFNQYNPKLVSDGAGGAIIVWLDDRDGAGAGNYDIYAQRINASGAVQWTADGVSICTATGVQNAQQVIADGSGGAIVAWSDGRTSGSSNADIYAQKVNASGVMQWGISGTTVCTSNSLQNIPQLVSDGAGGAVISWEDWRNFSQTDIYAQRMSSNGFYMWSFQGVVICSEPNFAAQYNTRIATDGSGGAIICWQDKRTSSSDDIYAQRVNSSGAVQWTGNGVLICNAAGLQIGSQIISDGSGGAIITWEDRRTERDIYAQRVNGSGAAQWTANGIVVCNQAGIQTDVQLTNVTGGAALLTWSDYRNSPGDIYAQKINAAGAVQWTANGVAVSTATNDQSVPALVSDGADGAIIAWQDLRTALDYDVYSSRLYANGTLPIRFISFTATARSNDADLAWTTTNEINTSHFDIEFSRDGILFEKIGAVPAANSGGTHYYRFTHSSPGGKIIYYRIREVDADGKFMYSDVARLTMQRTSGIRIYPNPVCDDIRLSNSNATEIKRLLITGTDGRTVLVFEMANSQVYDVRSLSKGVYFITLLKRDGSTERFPFIKQ